MIRYFTLLLTAIFYCTAATGQGWTLEQCINYAWNNNINIQQQVLVAEQYDNSLLQSKIALAPSINASAPYALNWGFSTVRRPLDDGTTMEVLERTFVQSFTPSISASMVLFQGLRKINNIRKMYSDYQAAQQDVENLRNEVALNVARAYLQVLLSMEILKVAESSHQSVATQLDRLKKLVDAGSLPMSDQLEMEAQLAAEQVQKITAQNQVDINYLTLRQLLDLPPASDFSIATPELMIDAGGYAGENIDNIYSIAQNLPQIKGAEYRMQSAQHDLAMSKSYFWPSLSVGASFGTTFSNPPENELFWDQLTNYHSSRLGFTLSIPIFNNWAYVTNTKNAKLNLRIAQLEVDNKRQLLYKEIQTATTDAAASYNKYQASQQNVTASKESFRYVEEKFEFGLLNATDYNISKNNLLTAQSEELQAKYQYIFQLKIIDFYKGLPIKL